MPFWYCFCWTPRILTDRILVNQHVSHTIRIQFLAVLYSDSLCKGNKLGNSRVSVRAELVWYVPSSSSSSRTSSRLASRSSSLASRSRRSSSTWLRSAASTARCTNFRPGHGTRRASVHASTVCSQAPELLVKRATHHEQHSKPKISYLFVCVLHVITWQLIVGTLFDHLGDKQHTRWWRCWKFHNYVV